MTRALIIRTDLLTRTYPFRASAESLSRTQLFHSVAVVVCIVDRERLTQGQTEFKFLDACGNDGRRDREV